MKRLGADVVKWQAVVAVMVSVGLSVGSSACDGRGPLPEPDQTPGPPIASATPTGGTTGTAPVDTAQVTQSLLARWNAVADAGGPRFDFTWGELDRFPHPTYKGGTAQAYRAFAAVLLAFFQNGDDFAFLAQNHLFQLPLVYIFPSGQNGLGTNFEMLARSFSASGAYGDIPADTQQALASFADRMDDPPAASNPVVVGPPDAGAPSSEDVYAAMCRHYCEALVDTDVYACVNRGGDAAGCITTVGGPDLCIQLRCVPKRIDPSLCAQQCDAAATQYGRVCTASNAPGAPLCQTPPADYDSTCRAGCALPPGP